MATNDRMPSAFSFRSRGDVPWVAVVSLTMLAVGFTVFASLETIATFSSLTFLLVSMAVSVANLKLRRVTQSRLWLVLLGMVLMATTTVLLVIHLWQESEKTFFWIAGVFAFTAIAEILFTRRNVRGRN